MDDINFLHDGIEIVINECPKGFKRKYVKVISAAIVISKNIFHDVGAGVKNIFGGELRSYSNLAEETFEQCLERLRNKAKAAGYDGVCNIRAFSPSIAVQASELVLYGIGFVYVSMHPKESDKKPKI